MLTAMENFTFAPGHSRKKSRTSLADQFRRLDQDAVTQTGQNLQPRARYLRVHEARHAGVGADIVLAGRDKGRGHGSRAADPQVAGREHRVHGRVGRGMVRLQLLHPCCTRSALRAMNSGREPTLLCRAGDRRDALLPQDGKPRLHPLALFRGAASHRAEQHQPATRSACCSAKPCAIMPPSENPTMCADGTSQASSTSTTSRTKSSSVNAPRYVRTRHARAGRDTIPESRRQGGSDVVPARAIRADTVDQDDRRPIATSSR